MTRRSARAARCSRAGNVSASRWHARLFGEPKLIVLDEPNANLDAAGEAALLAALQDLKARGVTVVVVTHNPTLMSSFDKLLLLKNGSLELFGPTAAVLGAHPYRDLAESSHSIPPRTRKRSHDPAKVTSHR